MRFLNLKVDGTHTLLRGRIKLIIKNIRKDKSGSIVVEASVSLVIFIAAIVSIISLINVFIVHNRIQFALNSAANQIASYSYLYEMSPVGEAVETLHNDGDPYIEKYDTVKGAIQALKNIFSSGNTMSADDWVNNGNSVLSGADTLADDPYAVAIGALYNGTINGEQFIENSVAGGLGYLLTRQYIAPSSMDANDYLDKHYVTDGYGGLNFTKSEFNHDTGLIVLDVTYDVEIPLINFFLKDYTLTIHQRACAKGWMDGDGNKYPKD